MLGLVSFFESAKLRLIIRIIYILSIINMLCNIKNMKKRALSLIEKGRMIVFKKSIYINRNKLAEMK